MTISKMHAERMWHKHTLKEERPSKTSWWLPVTKIPSLRKVRRLIYTSVTGWNMIDYTFKSSRTFGERFEEHFKTPSHIYHHCNITGHTTTVGNFSIVEREDQRLTRTIKESIYIRVSGPSLSKNIGKYHLPHIWDDVLFNTQNSN